MAKVGDFVFIEKFNYELVDSTIKEHHVYKIVEYDIDKSIHVEGDINNWIFDDEYLIVEDYVE